MTVAVILLAIAVIILAAPGWPSPWTIASFLLALVALLIVVVGWPVGR